jgi:hypothetical protein
MKANTKAHVDEFAASGESPPTHAVRSGSRTSRRESSRKTRLKAEARACFEHLRAFASSRRLRVVLDSEGWPFIPGKYGSIECVDPHRPVLAVYCDRPRLFKKLWAIPGVRRHQTGDREMRALFPPEAFAQVACVVRVRRKRGLSSERARDVGAKTAFRGTSPTSEGPGKLAANVTTADVRGGARDGR